jgi:hypothetical protein
VPATRSARVHLLTREDVFPAKAPVGAAGGSK